MRRLLILLLLVLPLGLAAPARGEDVAVLGGGQYPVLDQDESHNLYLAYQAQGRLVLRRSQDEGHTWTDEVLVAPLASRAWGPAMVVTGEGAVNLAWSVEHKIYFVHSSSEALSFGPAAEVAGPVGVSDAPCLDRGPDGSLHLAWASGTSVLHCQSADQGKSWSPPEEVFHSTGVCRYPAQAVGSDAQIHVAWLDASSGAERPDIFYARREGNRWVKPINVSNTPGLSGHPSIAVSRAGQVYLAWMDKSRFGNIWDIYFSRSLAPDRFSPPLFFDTPHDSLDPIIALEGSDRVAVVWTDASENAAAPDIYFVQSADSGETFTRPKNVSHTPGVSRRPTVAITSGHVLILWDEEQDGKVWLKMTWESFPKAKHQPVSSGKY